MRSVPLVWVLTGGLLVGCGDDGGAGESSSTGMTGDETSGTLTTGTTTVVGSSSGVGSGSTTGSGSGGSSSSGAAESSSSSGDAESSSSSGGSGVVVLQNDTWIDGMQTAVQGGFAEEECWASTYVPEKSHYPFRVRGFQVLISGDVEGVTQPFEVGVWTVDENNAPDTQIATALAEFTASNSEFNGVELDVLEVEDIIIDEGNFAISMCLQVHGGFPGVAADVGGEIVDDRNWLFTGGAWGQSSGFGLTGNWIQRAIIELQ